MINKDYFRLLEQENTFKSPIFHFYDISHMFKTKIVL